MRKALLLLCWLVPGGIASGQSTLNFPKVLTPTELGGTGFAVVNPGAVPANATFNLRSTAGVPLSTESRTVPAGGQLALTGANLFGTPGQSGWVQVTSAAAGLTGFFLTGDFETFTDGADPAPVSGNLVIPLVAADMEINVANTSSTPATVTLSLGQGDGGVLSSSTQSISARGALQAHAAALFPGADLDQATHIRITGGFSITATAVVRDFLVSPAIGVINGVPTSSTLTELNFSHVISGPLGPSTYLTSIGVTNLAGSTNTVSITFTPTSGTATTAERTIPPDGSFRESAESLFSFPATFQDGWIRVSGTAPVTGFVAYADSAAAAMAIVPVPVEPSAAMLFGHIAHAKDPSGKHWGTGLALLNTSNTAADVEVFLLRPDGGMIGGAQDSPNASFTVAPGTKVARVLNELVPGVDNLGGFVFVRTTNAVPLFGIELFFRKNLNEELSLLSNVSPGAVAPGITYMPPPPGGAIILTSVSPLRIARGGTLTLSGTGFSAGNTVVFTTPGGTSGVAAAFGSPTSLMATVPSTAISGPVFVSSGSETSGSLILEVTQSATELVQTLVAVSAGQVTAGVDIYVPPPAAGLNVTAIGSGDRFSGISAAASSVRLGRGQTTDLLIRGTGLAQANGSTPAVSGSGLTFSNVSFSGGSMFVAVTVSANAPVGPRTFSIINSNADASVLSGGIIIE